MLYTQPLVLCTAIKLRRFIFSVNNMNFHFCDLNHPYKNQERKIRSRKTAPGNIRKKQKGDNVSKTKSGRH